MMAQASGRAVRRAAVVAPGIRTTRTHLLVGDARV